MEKINEEAPAPTSTPEEEEDYTGSIFFCFKIDENIYNKVNFIIECNYINSLTHVIKPYNDFIVLRVFFSSFEKKIPKFIYSEREFKIILKNDIDIYYSSNLFNVKKGEIIFIYNAAEKCTMKTKEVKNPSCIEQFKSFYQILPDKEIIFIQTKEYLNNYLDFSLYLYLIENHKNKAKELFGLLDFFPNSKMIVLYNREKILEKIDFGPFSKNKNFIKLIIIYSVIRDETKLLNDFKENDLLIFLKYNEYHQTCPLIIKENIFKFFLSKTNKFNYIKKICQSCESIPILFNYLIEIGSDALKK